MLSELRRCLVCRCLNHRHLLFRLQKLPQGGVERVSSALSFGASLYVCQTLGCLQKLQKRRLLQKQWKTLQEQDVSLLCLELSDSLLPKKL
jgi:predicted RNA-binding protein YlxR (DUF448 family)